MLKFEGDKSMKITIIFSGNPNECVESIWVRVEGKEHLLDWDESQFSAGETHGRGVYLDGVYANGNLDFLRNAEVMSVEATDFSSEEGEINIDLERIREIALIEGEEQVRLAVKGTEFDEH